MVVNGYLWRAAFYDWNGNRLSLAEAYRSNPLLRFDVGYDMEKQCRIPGGIPVGEMHKIYDAYPEEFKGTEFNDFPGLPLVLYWAEKMSWDDVDRFYVQT